MKNRGTVADEATLMENSFGSITFEPNEEIIQETIKTPRNSRKSPVLKYFRIKRCEPESSFNFRP
jgi:hypothetical protein